MASRAASYRSLHGSIIDISRIIFSVVRGFFFIFHVMMPIIAFAVTSADIKMTYSIFHYFSARFLHYRYFSLFILFGAFRHYFPQRHYASISRLL